MLASNARWPAWFAIAIVLVGVPWNALQAQINLIPPTQPHSPSQVTSLPAVRQEIPAQVPAGQDRPLQFRSDGQPTYRTAQQPNGLLPASGQLPPSAGVNPNGTAQGVSATVAPAPQVAQPVSDVVSITPEAVATYLQQLQAAPELEATLKKDLIATYEAILAELKSRAESEKVTKEFIIAYEAAPVATADAKKRKENPRPRVVFSDEMLRASPIETLRSFQIEVQAMAQAATDGRIRVETAISTRESRRKELPLLTAEDKSSILKINEQLALPAVDGVDPRIREANTLLLRSKLMALNERVRRLDQEQRTYDAELELLPIRKEVLITEEKFQQAKLKEVSDELNKRRESLIAKQKNLAQGLIARAAPDLKWRAEQLVKRAEDWLQLAKDNASLRADLDSATSELKLWTNRFTLMSDRIKPKKTDDSRHVASFNSWVGLMLRKQRNELPDIVQLSLKLRDYRARVVSTDWLILELDDWKASSVVTTDAPQQISLSDNVVEVFANAPAYEQKRMLETLESKLISEFRLDASSYSDNLIRLADKNHETIEEIKRFRTFIDEHVLWIRSSEPINKTDFRQLWPSLKWLFDLENWRIIPAQLWSDLQLHPWAYGFGFLSYLALLLSVKRCKKHIQLQGAIASKANCTSFLPTAKVVLDCLLLSSPLALLHIILGWRLMSTSDGNRFVEAIAMGLMVSARYFFPLEMIRQISRAGGLAENHFQWPVHSTQLLRKNLRWFIDLAIPAVTVVGIVSQFGEARWENSLGRLIYSILMSLCFLYLLVLFHPSKGVFSDFLSRNANGWIDRLKYFWYTGLAASPLALMTMSLMGYHYTATRLTMLMHTTFITLIGLLLLSSLIRRWLLLRRRQIVVAQARQRLEEARRREPGGAVSNSLNAAALAVDARTDLAQINAQTIRLVGSTLIFAAIGAVAFIWSGVLPAVSVLEGVKIGEVTLAQVFFAVPIAIMTIVAARNLPGLLEIALLQHLPIENAVRYAIASLSRYTILILGIALTFNSIGVKWSNIQWLVAALGVGLGFGLQEIFANFVSGLILLFEQPIRVGDIITLGDTTGSVSRIRMRATTVTNFDQQELIIPNKDLITGRLLNWTLSDSTNRMIIQVGVSHNSDPELACTIVREVCCKHPNVMQEPAPTAYFEQFGDSTLDLKARFYLANLDQRLPTRHDLHSQIRKRFAEAGIEISFPQRDLHLRSMPRELVSLLNNEQMLGDKASATAVTPGSSVSQAPAVANPAATKRTGNFQGE